MNHLKDYNVIQIIFKILFMGVWNTFTINIKTGYLNEKDSDI